MEQGRTPLVLVRQHELARPAAPSYEAVVNLIGSTTTKSGLRVKALLDTRDYEPSPKITNDGMRRLRLMPVQFHGDWNYTLHPRHTR